MKLTILIICMFIINFSFGQRKNLSIDYEVLSEKRSNIAVLVITDTISYWSKKDNNNQDVFFYKNNITNVAYFVKQLSSMNFYVSDTLNKFKWTLSNDTTTILGYKCNSAITQFRGRTYKAYYTTSIAYSDGPWKLCGLPGLILRAKTEDDFVEWRASNIKEISNYPNRWVEYAKNKFIGWEDFVLEYKLAMDRNIKRYRSSYSTSGDIKGTVKIPSIEIFYPELQTGEGLKF